MIEKPTLGRTRPIRVGDDFVPEDDDRADRKLVQVEAPACPGQSHSHSHELLIERSHPGIVGRGCNPSTRDSQVVSMLGISRRTFRSQR